MKKFLFFLFAMVLMLSPVSCKKDNGNKNGEGGDPPIDFPGDAVDLGLSVMWAYRNIGAANTEDTGMAFGWGCTEPSTPHTYVPSSIYPFTDEEPGPEKLSGEYDAATAIWGNGWRMPTQGEIRELNALGYTAVKKDGIEVGATFQGKNGNSIYIPFGAPDRKSFEIWSSERGSSVFTFAYYYNNKGEVIANCRREIAHFIRPVKDKN